MAKISRKTHSSQQINNYANQKNPNNPSYLANVNNRANQKNPNNLEYKSK